MQRYNLENGNRINLEIKVFWFLNKKSVFKFNYEENVYIKINYKCFLIYFINNILKLELCFIIKFGVIKSLTHRAYYISESYHLFDIEVKKQTNLG